MILDVQIRALAGGWRICGSGPPVVELYAYDIATASVTHLRRDVPMADPKSHDAGIAGSAFLQNLAIGPPAPGLRG